MLVDVRTDPEAIGRYTCTLDGVEQHDVVAADDVAGWVDRQVRDADGHRVIDAFAHAVTIERLHGIVVINAR